MQNIQMMSQHNSISIIDSHAHLTSDEIWPKVEETLSAAAKANVKRIINICTDATTLERGLELAIQHPWISNVAATTPHDVEKEGESFFPIVEKAAKAGKLVAIGETGLDHHYEHSPKALQQHFLIRYFTLATHYNLPVVIHCREAFEDLFMIADQHYKNKPLLLHCFTGSKKEAKEALERGWKISISGIVTFKKSESLREAVREIPAESLLIETDSPYLAPQSHRGEQNQPAFLPETLQFLATLKGMPPQELATVIYQNSMDFFRLPAMP